MGNEMGNNNVIGQQASEESAKDFDKTMHHSDCSPDLNNMKDKEKGDTKDVDSSEVLKAPLTSNGGDEKMASDQTKVSAANEDVDEKNKGSLQDYRSTQDDDGNSNLPTEEGDETQDGETETITNSTEAVGPVRSAVEDIPSNKDTSSSDEKFKQLVHESAEESEESTLANPPRLLEENIESLPEDEEESCSQEVAVVGGNLVAEDTVENLEGEAGVSTVYDLPTPSSVQGETKSSTESILTDYHDAETKEIFIKDEPRERGNPSYVQPVDDTKQETSKNDIFEMGKSKSCKTTAIDTVIGSDHEVLEEYKNIHGLENQEEDTGEAVSPFQSAFEDPSPKNGKEFQIDELSIAVEGEMSDSISAATDPTVIEITQKEQGGNAEKDVADKNEADNFEGDKTSDGIHDFVSTFKVHGEDFTGLDPPLSGPLPILNEEKVQEGVIVEELAALTMATSSALERVENSVEKDIKPASSDSNEGTTTSTYEAKSVYTQESMNNSQCDQPQQVLLEEPEVVKFENSETLTTCLQMVECNSTTELTFPDVLNKKREGASATTTFFTSESNQEKVAGNGGFAAESRQKKVSANTDKSNEEQCLLQEPTLGRDAGEETPLLLSTESINSLSYSSEQHIKVVKDIPVVKVALMQAKEEAVEESEKSPLLSPREPSEGAFREPNQCARNNKPLHSIMTEDRVGTWSPLKEQEPVPKDSTAVSSPRSKEKPKPKSSFFAICMCCTTATN